MRIDSAHDGTAGARKGAFLVRDMTRYRHSARPRTEAPARCPEAVLFPENRIFYRFCGLPRLELSNPSRIGSTMGLRPLIGHKEIVMLSWVVTFLIIALVAGLLGFGGIAGASIEIAKIVFFVAIVLFAVSALIGLMRGGRPTV